MQAHASAHKEHQTLLISRVAAGTAASLAALAVHTDALAKVNALPPIDTSDPNRCERATLGNNIGQPNGLGTPARFAFNTCARNTLVDRFFAYLRQFQHFND